ncbi:MAG TPA: glycosyltransferase family 2 protein [Tabrizicola sp.]|nr:glycosyltransferase family 2 protein [Tabrizicola sp.]
MISIVVPTFRREELLGPLFRAVASQIKTIAVPVELVLVDNSPDGSARSVLASAPDFVRYVHEPQTGVARARNRGIAEARGAHIIFLDDDEMPDPGWLAAFAGAVARGDPAAFGSIEPEFQEQPAEHLRGPLDRVFSRRFPAASGQDIGHLRAYLGSGNSMFRREVLMLESPVFDPAFDAGGEDVWLLRKLVECHGIALMWCPDARVREIVPDRRATLAFLQQRRFSDGQLRCVVDSSAGGLRGAYRVAVWMAVGAAQVVLHGGLALATRPFSRRRSTQLGLTAVGGLGKLLWWKRKLKG